MSLRPMLWSVPSIQPLRSVIGSNDTAWLDIVNAELGDQEESLPNQHDSIRKAATELLVGRLDGPEKDSHVEVVGLWAKKVLPLADFDYAADPKSLDLTKPRMLTDGDWKHFAWDDYRALIEPLVNADVARMVGHLTEGRPLVGTHTESSWSYYAWFERQELEKLINGLATAGDQNKSVADEVDGFHVELVEWLKGAQKCGALWLYAW